MSMQQNNKDSAAIPDNSRTQQQAHHYVGGTVPPISVLVGQSKNLDSQGRDVQNKVGNLQKEESNLSLGQQGMFPAYIQNSEKRTGALGLVEREAKISSGCNSEANDSRSKAKEMDGCNLAPFSKHSPTGNKFMPLQHEFSSEEVFMRKEAEWKRTKARLEATMQADMAKRKHKLGTPSPPPPPHQNQWQKGGLRQLKKKNKKKLHKQS